MRTHKHMHTHTHKENCKRIPCQEHRFSASFLETHIATRKHINTYRTHEHQEYTVLIHCSILQHGNQKYAVGSKKKVGAILREPGIMWHVIFFRPIRQSVNTSITYPYQSFRRYISTSECDIFPPGLQGKSIQLNKMKSKQYHWSLLWFLIISLLLYLMNYIFLFRQVSDGCRRTRFLISSAQGTGWAPPRISSDVI